MAKDPDAEDEGADGQHSEGDEAREAGDTSDEEVSRQ